MTNTVIYKTLDYGDRPFKVKVTDKKITVYDNYDSIKNGKKWEPMIKKKLLTIPLYKKVFIGSDVSGNDFGKGNSILVNTETNKYTFIGDQIYSFRITDKIVSYHSNIGNSGVPYPYAVGTDYTYLTRGSVKILNKNLEPGDPYHHYYNINKSKKAVDLRKFFEKFDTDTIQERLYHICSHSD